MVERPRENSQREETSSRTGTTSNQIDEKFTSLKRNFQSSSGSFLLVFFVTVAVRVRRKLTENYFSMFEHKFSNLDVETKRRKSQMCFYEIRFQEKEKIFDISIFQMVNVEKINDTRWDRLTEVEFNTFFDSDGRLVKEHDFRKSVFKGELEVSSHIWETDNRSNEKCSNSFSTDCSTVSTIKSSKFDPFQ